MRINRVFLAIGMIIAFGMFFEIAAHAGELNERTRITFSVPVQIPGQVLPAGTYMFEQANPVADPNLIQVFNADHTALLATVQTVSAERMEPTEKTTITLAEPQSENPVLLKWFYPGSLTGHEFVYPRQQEQAAAQAPQQTFVANPEAAGE